MQDSDWTLPVLKMHLDDRLAHAEADRRALEGLMDRRFGRVEAASERTALMMSRPEVETALTGVARRNEDALKIVAAKNEDALKMVTTKVDAFGRTNWSLLISMAGLVALLVSGTWAVVSLKIENGLTPLRLEISELQSELRFMGHKPAP